MYSCPWIALTDCPYNGTSKATRVHAAKRGCWEVISQQGKLFTCACPVCGGSFKGHPARGAHDAAVHQGFEAVCFIIYINLYIYT